MYKVLQKFLASEDGAVTVDWVVVTAGVVGLALSVFGLMMGMVEPGADNLGSFLTDRTTGVTW